MTATPTGSLHNVALEPAAFCKLIRPRLVASLALYCGDSALAEEFAQEALVRAWERWPKVSRMDSPEAWTFRTGTNLANSWFRRRKAERRAKQRIGPVPTTTTDPDSAQSNAVRAALAMLAPRQRAVIVARFYLGLDVAATATSLGISPGTVKSTTHAALARLRTSGHLTDLHPSTTPQNGEQRGATQ